jgi:hypothetical protein
MVAFHSETIYIEVHNHASSAVALFISAIIYAGVAGYYYYNIFMNVDRKEELRRWLLERKNHRQTEMSVIKRGE